MELRPIPSPFALLRDFLITFPAVNVILVSLTLAIGIPITSIHVLLSLFPCLVIAYYWNNHHNFRTLITASILLVVLFTSAILLSIWMIDIYGDSRSYHGPAVISLSDGWNPYHDWTICSWDSEYCVQTNEFIDHYPKAQWYISAEFYRLFGDIDVGKCMNLVMLFLCFLVAYQIVDSLLPNRPALSALVSVGIALNPVAVAQLYSGTVDGLLSSTLSIFILLLIGYFFSKEKKYIHQSMLIMIYLVNLKFTGLIYASAFSVLFFIVILWTRSVSSRYFSSSVLITLFISVLIVGFNPYLTNIIVERNPFSGAVEIESGTSVIDQQADAKFLSKNRFEKLFISIFSVGRKSSPKAPEFALPLSRWKLNRGIAVRFAGFGPMFSAIVILGIFQAVRLRDGPSIALTLCVLITVFATSAGWWPRLAPQMWLVLCLVHLFVLVGVTGPLSQKVAVGVLAAMILNSALVFAGVFTYQRNASSKFYQDLLDARADSLSLVVTDNRHNLLGFYNRRKIVDSLGSDELVVAGCETRKENRIFGICRGPLQAQ